MPKSWFVTGSSRGLGRAIVMAALEAGHTVMATARNPGDLDDLVTRYRGRIIPYALDVSDAAAVGQAVADAKDTFGRVDVVVNNAGYASLASVEDMSQDAFADQMATNFFGTVHVSKAVVPILRAQGAGHIFQIASVGSRIASVGLSAYQAAKFAVRGFSLVLAQELAPLGIKVTILQPGGVRTDWAGSSMTIPAISEPYRQTVGPFAEMLRAGSGKEPADPRKVARAIVDLSGRDDAPVELLIGEDAYAYAQRAADAVAASDRAWKDLTVSVAF
ncbi:SDR family NAD(P)-dependent oxidoreductase [Methylobacterium brachiatum]|uniref:SDR family NAD(P)-dependent oxidoreductase n=1 Tax=Methylobacterium brachiatum TaxID=269660 RepID=A0ABV1R0J4_9HYPH